ncbi:MAG: glycosyltransferase family 39 protein [Alphaproteobacteria bacterium]|nr:glycosyltransferase family 39 protein [Alphaproteobacteria bacterium]
MAPHSRSAAANQGLVALLVSLVTLTVFAALFVFRFLDDNRLTSWQWAFDQSDIRVLAPILAAGVALAWAASGVLIPARTQGAMLIASALAAAMVFWGAPEVVVDAARYFMQAKYLELYGGGFFLREWGREIAAWTDLPLVPFLHGVVFDLFGETRMAIQAFSSLLLAGTVALTWLIGRILWDDTVGGCAAALLLAMPYLLVQPALMLVDVPTMFFLTLAVFTTLKAVREGGAGPLLASAAAISLALLSKYSTWLLLSVVPVIVFTHLDCGFRAVFRRAAAIALATLLLAGTFVLVKYDVVTAQLELLWTYQLPGLARWEESHASTFLFQIHPFVTAAALCSLAVAFVRRDRKFAIVAWMLLLLAVLGVKRARYILIALPMLALMAGYALREVTDGRIRRFIVSCAIVSTFVTSVFGYLPLLKRTSAMNLLEAGEHLDGMDVEAVEVYALPQPRSVINPAVVVPILDLFTEKRIIYRGNGPAPPAPALIATSPLRFTWEYATPDYFRPRTDSPRAAAVAVIVGRRDQPLPDHIGARIADSRLSREFSVSDNLFRFKTLVRVYQTP